MRRLIATVLLMALTPAALAAVKAHEYQLDNGMKVIVKEDHRAPIVTTQVWYKVGSSYEYGGVTGVSHALEHMMFKGTKKYGPNEFSRIIAANGGEENAFTGRDYTAYFQTLAKDRLEVSFQLEADRMRNLILSPEEFKKEIEVVKEERRLRTEDKPTGLTYERFNASAYEASPYRNPVIGWMSDLDSMTHDDLQAWYTRWYAPNNATLVVVGDVEPDAVHQLAKKYFAPLKSELVSPVKPREEPPQKGVKRLTVKAPAKQPYLIMGYKTPVIGGEAEPWEPYALEMLASVLDGGSSARLTKNLVRGSQIATAAEADYSAFHRLPGMLLLDGTPTREQNTAELERALRQEIERLRNEPVSEDELRRVRNQVIAAKVYERDSVFYQAMQIGMLETIGLNWRLGEEFVERLQEVTAQQVQAVAKKYLVEDRLTVAVLDPQPMEETSRPRAAAAAGDRHGH